MDTSPKRRTGAAPPRREALPKRTLTLRGLVLLGAIGALAFLIQAGSVDASPAAIVKHTKIVNCGNATSSIECLAVDLGLAADGIYTARIIDVTSSPGSCDSKHFWLRTKKHVEVAPGCIGQFAVTEKVWMGTPTPAKTKTVTCDVGSGTFRSCPTGVNNITSVDLVDTNAGQNCADRWTASDTYIDVETGCGGTFSVEYYTDLGSLDQPAPGTMAPDAPRPYRVTEFSCSNPSTSEYLNCDPELRTTTDLVNARSISTNGSCSSWKIREVYLRLNPGCSMTAELYYLPSDAPVGPPDGEVPPPSCDGRSAKPNDGDPVCEEEFTKQITCESNEWNRVRLCQPNPSALQLVDVVLKPNPSSNCTNRWSWAADTKLIRVWDGCQSQFTVTYTGPDTEPKSWWETPLVVTMGDSFASGEGSVKYPGDLDHCHRFDDAYGPSYAAGNDYLHQWLACSGDTITDLRNGQLRSVREDADYIVLSISGNDMGFGDALQCMYDDEGDDPSACFTTQQASLDHLRGTNGSNGDLRTLYQQILLEAPTAKLMVFTYPLIFDVLYDSNGTPTCVDTTGRPINNFSGAEAEMADNWTRRLDGAIKDTVNVLTNELGTSRIQLVDVAPSFSGGGVCHSSDFINPIVPRGDLTPATSSFHPTPLGYDLYLDDLCDVVGNCLGQRSRPPAPTPRPTPPAPEPPAPTPAPVCQMLTNGDFSNGLAGWQSTWGNSAAEAGGMAVTNGVRVQGADATPGTSYTVTGSYRTVGHTGGRDVGIDFLDASGTKLSDQKAGLGESNEMTGFTATATAPAGTAKVLVWVWSGSSGKTIVDDITLAQGSCSPGTPEPPAPEPPAPEPPAPEPPAPAPACQMLTNGDFANGLSNWQSTWGSSSAEAGGMAVANGVRVQQVSATAGTSYTVTGDYRTVGHTGGRDVGIDFVDASGTKLAQTTAGLDQSDAVSNFTATATAPSGTAGIVIWVWSGDTGKTIVDNITLAPTGC